MVKLSVIIVNYNVKHFLEQCLLSVLKASEGLSVEVIVVDNNSVDGSIAMLKDKFKTIQLIENKENIGFSKANNQGISKANGEYVLLLNPDTVVSEDTFRKTIDFMDHNPVVGGLGVRMIDGNGKFLPESKRGLPTPEVAFYKMAGLSTLFPKSKRFGKYHLGFISENQNSEVEILSGAFMLMRRSALEKSGLLDETFFMYGEDIDLSYRILKAGYKNYYFADTTIIHYKGESTKKHSVNYVKVFYKAMAIFAQKHYSSGNARMFVFLINAAIALRASLALVRRLLVAIWLPITDLLLMYATLTGIVWYWEHYNKWVLGGFYPYVYKFIHLPIYCVVWILGIWLSGGYKNPVSMRKLIRGIVFGSLMLLLLYGLLPESMRYSRAILMLGSLSILAFIPFSRLFYQFLFKSKFAIEKPGKEKILIVGSNEDTDKVKWLLSKTGKESQIVGTVNSDNPNSGLGTLEQLPQIIEVVGVDEIIFCTNSIGSEKIIALMSLLPGDKVRYKIMPGDVAFIIGSNSKNVNGELYTIEVHLKLSEPYYIRLKRFTDLILSVLAIFLTPLVVLGKKMSVLQWIEAISCVLYGKKTWISYAGNASGLPTIKNGLLSVSCNYDAGQLSETIIKQIDFQYARDYSVLFDVKVFFKGFIKNCFLLNR